VPQLIQLVIIRGTSYFVLNADDVRIVQPKTGGRHGSAPIFYSRQTKMALVIFLTKIRHMSSWPRYTRLLGNGRSRNPLQLIELSPTIGANIEIGGATR
jgi:hypothetical protein